MTKKIWIGTNWKMTKTAEEGLAYCRELVDFVQKHTWYIEIFIIPSYTLLWPIRQILRDSKILLGAQNMHWEERGAYTGEISPLMLEELGIDIVELGHSERRQLFHEQDRDIHKKVHSAL